LPAQQRRSRFLHEASAACTKVFQKIVSFKALQRLFIVPFFFWVLKFNHRVCRSVLKEANGIMIILLILLTGFRFLFCTTFGWRRKRKKRRNEETRID
jgi:hypothetical protein